MRALLGAYGSFLCLEGTGASLLLLLATLVEPKSGLLALVSAAGVAVARRLLPVTGGPLVVQLVNALLVGHVLAATYQPSLPLLVLLILSGPLTVLACVRCSQLVQPVLCLPFVVVSFGMMAAAHALYLPLLPAAPLPSGPLASMGGVYLSPYPLSGLLVLAALVLTSRMLVLLAFLGWASSAVSMLALGVPPNSYAVTLAGTQGILACMMVGGLWLSPGLPAVLLGMMAACLAGFFYLACANWLSVLSLPPLALPFLLATWAVLSHFRPQSSGFWRFQRLAAPQRPEITAERQVLAAARGLDPESVALRLPVAGRWSIYQAFDGPHTHMGAWRYALDFYRVQDGTSFRERGLQLSDYHCYGMSVFSPAYGVIADCRDDLADNPVGEVDLKHRWGNFALLQLADGHFVLLAHLQQGSLAVKTGDRVEPGQLLARCGNSGRSPQPHLHMHVQKGMPLGSPTVLFHLTGVLQNRGFSLNCRPKTGDVVAPAPAGPLGKALSLPVGTRLVYRAGGRLRTLEVELDVLGEFWLRSDSGARVAFLKTGEVLAMYQRCATADPFLDAWTLAMGLTPLADGALEWTDRPPARLAGAAWWRLNLESCYRRTWDPGRQHWVQEGWHGRLSTYALLSEETVPTEFGVRGGLCARLEELGMKSDEGIPGWNWKAEKLVS